jgi:hypothetical protein
MSTILYGIPFQTYAPLGSPPYTADGDGRIGNVLDSDVRALHDAGCIDQAAWLALYSAQGNSPRALGVTIYTLTNADDRNSFPGAFLIFTSDSPVALNAPFGLSFPFRCQFAQGGAGVVTPTASPGVTINNVDGFTKTSGQYAVMELIGIAQDVYILDGAGSV